MKKQLSQEQKVDQLIKTFWKNGYLTLSRKYGTYLPEPSPIGNYEVDVVGKKVKKYAIGITLNENDLNDPNIRRKIEFLASRQTRNTNNRVMLFVGVENNLIKRTRGLIKFIPEEIRKFIKVVPHSHQRYN
ncbi:MAG: hypothetical protein K8F36_06180 [Melioribacteraceae bacterium]|nr:hypothetical protein [Melioribacteraceae bacterium]